MLNKFKIGGMKTIIVVTIASVALAGCMEVPTGNATVSAPRVQKLAFNDNCAKLRDPFIKIRQQRDKVIGESVASGVVVGAVGALLLGGDAEDAIKGAVIGGLAGAAAAYAKNAASRGATDASLARFANADARNEAAQNDRLVRTIVEMNACRIDQADRAVARAARKEISPEMARQLLNQIKRETRNDNLAVQRVAGFNRTYNAYVGVLDKKDVAAARATRRSVAAYKPKVKRVKRTGSGKAAIAPQRPPSAPTQVANAENSRRLIRTAAVESQASVDAEIAERNKRLDALIARNAI